MYQCNIRPTFLELFRTTIYPKHVYLPESGHAYLLTSNPAVVASYCSDVVVPFNNNAYKKKTVAIVKPVPPPVKSGVAPYVTRYSCGQALKSVCAYSRCTRFQRRKLRSTQCVSLSQPSSPPLSASSVQAVWEASLHDNIPIPVHHDQACLPF